MKLVIIESPGKIKKLSAILGDGYKVVASIGHCIDLPQKKLGVNIKKDFEPTYEVLPNKQEVLNNIINLAKNAEHCILASDPDREGEFIGYIISQQLPKSVKYSRATFNAITPQAVLDGIAKAGSINMDLVNSQQTRRILDRLVGFKTSPIATKFVAGARSAGRVQSAVLRIICEREEEIEAFVPQEYWDISGEFDLPLIAELKKPQFGARDEKDLSPKKLEAFKAYCQNAEFTLSDVVVSELKDNPRAPFTTSSLQQAASSLFGWGAKKTMTLAQQLFNVGRITYHRTDSVALAKEFVSEVRTHISTYGANYLPSTQPTYTSKISNAQEAHEACRVTYLTDQNFTNDDDGKLYELIWRRSVASQMTSAVYTKTKAIISDPKENTIFESHTKVQKFEGHLKVWTYSKPAVETAPNIKKGQKCKLLKLNTEQKFTNPPGRYTDGGSLTKCLEEKGIGRPATLAGMTSTLIDREYATKDGNSLKPTLLGRELVKFLKKNAFSFIDLDFTAKMEDELDEISNGKKAKLTTLQNFWSTLDSELKKTESSVAEATPHKDVCPTCKGTLLAKNGRFGPYVICSDENCGYKSALTVDGNLKPKNEVVEHGVCPKCNKKTYLKSGKFGQFIACEDYAPKNKGECTYTAQIAQDGAVQEKKQAEIVEGISCPKCSKPIAKRKGRYGDFYGCTGYPKCKTITDETGKIKIPGKRGGGKKKKKDG